MLKRVINWLGLGDTTPRNSGSTKPAAHSSPHPADPAPVRQPNRPHPSEQVASPPPPAPANRLIRNKFLREDTGTHETLKILDDSIIDSGEEEGFDPYNTGDFDRSRNWERRFRD